MNIANTLRFVRAAHGDQTDKAGQPYWQHPGRVMRLLGDDTEEAKQVALLHDVLEDTHVDMQDLITAGFSNDVIIGVLVLTREHSETYTQYIHKIVASGNGVAMRVKLADLADNLDPKRAGAINESLIRRYRTAYATIEAALLRRCNPYDRYPKELT